MVFWSVENRWWALLLLVILQFSSLVFFVANNSIKFSLPQKFTEDIWTKASIFAQPLPLPRPTLTCLKHVRPSPLDVSNLMVRFFCQLDRVSWVRRLLNQYGTFLRLQGGLVVPRLFWDRVFLGWLMECILRWVQEECYYDKLLRSLQCVSVLSYWTRRAQHWRLVLCYFVHSTVDYSSRYQNLLASYWWIDNLHLGWPWYYSWWGHWAYMPCPRWM